MIGVLVNFDLFDSFARWELAKLDRLIPSRIADSGDHLVGFDPSKLFSCCFSVEFFLVGFAADDDQQGALCQGKSYWLSHLRRTDWCK